MQGIFLTSRGPVGLSGRTLLHAVSTYVQILVATWSRRPTFVHFCRQPHILRSTSQHQNRATMVVDRKYCFLLLLWQLRVGSA